MQHEIQRASYLEVRAAELIREHGFPQLGVIGLVAWPALAVDHELPFLAALLDEHRFLESGCCRFQEPLGRDITTYHDDTADQTH